MLLFPGFVCTSQVQSVEMQVDRTNPKQEPFDCVILECGNFSNNPFSILSHMMSTQNRTDNESAIDSPSPVKLDHDLDHEEAGDDDGEDEEDEDDDHDSGDSVSSSPRRGKKKRDNSTLRKAPQAPKRFKSSYICFFMAKQPEIKEELGDKATVTEISKRSAEMW